MSEPLITLAAIAGAFALAFLAALWRGVSGFRWPDRYDAQRRMERETGVPHRPLEALNDQIAATLIARADEALYMAKRNGRDRSQLWEPGLCAFDGALPGRRSIGFAAITDEQIARP